MSGPDSGSSDDERTDRDSDRRSSDETGTPDGTERDRQYERDRDVRADREDVPPGARSRRSAPGERSADRRGTRGPSAVPADDSTSDVTIEDDGLVRWYLKTDNETVAITRDVLSSVAIVAVIGLLLFGISGIWPPLVAVESGSMEPNMERGDLIFVVDNERFVGDDPVDGTGIVPLEHGQESGHDSFGQAGDVIVFRPDGSEARTPVIHRAHFWVERDENWVETQADEEIIGDATCDEVATCPADHAGFVTKGDNNDGYDQHQGHVSDIVRPEWVTGKASFRIPWLGHVRLAFDDFFGGMVAPSPVIDTTSMSTPIPLDDATVQASLAGATGFAGVGAAAAMAIGRRRY